MEATQSSITHPVELAKQLARAASELRRRLEDSPALAAECGQALASEGNADLLAQLAVFELLLGQTNGRRDASSPLETDLIDDIAGVLKTADIDAVHAAMQRQYAARDPLERFYELFLTQYDARLRRRRGVFYTPSPVVDYIVRSVACLLENDLGDAIARGPLRVIDPACGSGTFLSAVLQQGGVLKEAELLGWELMPAASAIARLLLSRRAAFDVPTICCGNPLMMGEELTEAIFAGGALPVIVGNPPYSNFGRQNRGPWIRKLLDDYKAGLAEKKLNLDDDFIKFLRWGQYWVDRAGRGIVAYVTSNTYLHGLTHRAMRRSLCRSFSDIYLLDLGGDVSRGGRAHLQQRDENVFGIRQGVAIGLFVKRPGRARPARVQLAELRGSRDEKFQRLDSCDVATTKWRTISPHGPSFYFTATAGENASEYFNYPRLDEIFCEHVSGVQTKNDELYTAFSRRELADRMQTELAGNAACPFDESQIRPYMVAPLDVRWVYYDRRLLGRARWQTMRHMLRENVALVFMRQSTGEGPYDHFLLTRMLVSDRVFYSRRGAPFLAPLYLYPPSDAAIGECRPNIDSSFAEEFAARLGWKYFPKVPTACKYRQPAGVLTPRAILHYAYAVFHGTRFRRDYGERLRVDFPRLPCTSDASLFGRLSRLGRQLADLHLVEPPPDDCSEKDETASPMALVAGGYPKIAVLKGPSQQGVVNINNDAPLLKLNRQDWEFNIGGYPVLPRWLKQRRGRHLTIAELSYARRLATIAAETREIVAAIDASLGEWPIR